jgi:hypothetical protein
VVHGHPVPFQGSSAIFILPHGGKEWPSRFPVPVKVYDETIETLRTAIDKAKLGNTDKQQAIKALTNVAQASRKKIFIPRDNVQGIYRKGKNGFVEVWW